MSGLLIQLRNEAERGECECCARLMPKASNEIMRLSWRIAELEKDVERYKNLWQFYKQWIIDAGLPIPEEQGL